MKYIKGSNQHVKKVSVKSEFKRIMKESLKVVMVLSFVSGSIVGTYALGGASTSAQVVYASVPTPVETMPDIPVLDAIEKCESSDMQFNKQGQVLIHVNTNGTYDIGEFQINSIWNATATKMGFDLTKASDNKAFAQFLFINKGSSAWQDSSACWSK